MQKFIIIGGGARGLYFTEILEKELNHKVVAIMDNYVQGNPFIEHRLKEANIEGVKLFNDLKEIIQAYPSDQVDGAFIMTPEWTHKAIFDVLTQHQYNVFLEKPVAISKEDVIVMKHVSDHYPKTLQIGFVLRYSAFYRQIKQWIQDVDLGRIVNIQMSERLTVEHGTKFKRSWHRLTEYTGGFMNEKCSHDLDLMCWFKEHEARPIGVMSLGHRGFAQHSVNETSCAHCSRLDCLYRDDVSSYAKTVNGKVYSDETSKGIGQCIYGNDSDIVDNQSVLVHFSDGSHGNFNVIAMSGKHGRDIMIHCEYGLISGTLESGYLELLNYRTKEHLKVNFTGMNMHGGGDTQVIKEFIDCLTHHTPPISTVADGLRASLLAFAADESRIKQTYIPFNYDEH